MKKLIIAFTALFVIMAAIPAVINLASYLPDIIASAGSQDESKTSIKDESRTADSSTESGSAADSEGDITIKTGDTTQNISLKDAVAGTLAAIMPDGCSKEAAKALAAAVYSNLLSTAQGGETPAITADEPFLSADEAKKDKGVEFYSSCEQYAEFALNTKIEYEGKPAELLIFSSCAGSTLNASDILSSPPPGHTSASSPWDMYSNITSQQSFTSAEAEKILKESFGVDEIPKDIENAIKIKKTAQNGAVLEAEICGKACGGIEIMNAFSLKSPCFTLSAQDDSLKFTVEGEGVPVGMSISGAVGMANQGAGWQEILSHYYSGLEISEITPEAQ